jgi:hypothetical protein
MARVYIKVTLTAMIERLAGQRWEYTIITCLMSPPSEATKVGYRYLNGGAQQSIHTRLRPYSAPPSLLSNALLINKLGRFQSNKQRG